MNNEDVRRELEQYIAHHHATDVGAVGDAMVVEDTGEGSDDYALLEALTGAVNPEPEYLGDEGGGSGSAATPPVSTPPTGTSLNAGVEGDAALSAWFNNMS